MFFSSADGFRLVKWLQQLCAPATHNTHLWVTKKILALHMQSNAVDISICHNFKINKKSQKGQFFIFCNFFRQTLHVSSHVHPWKMSSTVTVMIHLSDKEEYSLGAILHSDVFTPKNGMAQNEGWYIHDRKFSSQIKLNKDKERSSWMSCFQCSCIRPSLSSQQSQIQQLQCEDWSGPSWKEQKMIKDTWRQKMTGYLLWVVETWFLPSLWGFAPERWHYALLIWFHGFNPAVFFSSTDGTCCI